MPLNESMKMILYFLFGYILIGTIFVFVGPAATSFYDERHKNNLNPEINAFQKLGFNSLLSAGIIFFWPILVPSAWKSQKNGNLFKDIIELNDALSHTNNSRIDADEFPNGLGDFGSLSNPIPCGSIIDARRYLSHLTTAEGKCVSFERVGSFQSEACEMPVDGYIIKVDGVNTKSLYLSPYQIRNSKKAPCGFVLQKDLREVD